MPKTPNGNEIADNIKILNNKQRVVSNICYKWARFYVKFLLEKGKAIHIFMPDCVGIGKSHVVKTFYQDVSKLLLYHTNNPDSLVL